MGRHRRFLRRRGAIKTSAGRPDQISGRAAGSPAAQPKAEVLTDRANQVVNSLIEKHGEDKSRLLGPDERAAYREACTLYDGALKNMEVKDDKLSSRILLNMATCHWQINEFGPARKAASKALDLL